MYTHKSCEIDLVPTSLLKVNNDTILSFVTDHQEIITTGSVSISTQLSKYQTKINLNIDLKNYCFMFNLTYLYKLLERVALQQIIGHLTLHNLLEPNQSAYRQDCSRGHSYQSESWLAQGIRQQGGSMLVLLDLFAAFDAADHAILLQHLRVGFGVNSWFLSWLESYLIDRHGKVVTADLVLGEVTLDQVTLTYGVPQGMSLILSYCCMIALFRFKNCSQCSSRPVDESSSIS